jgi:hypothetical protein
MPEDAKENKPVEPNQPGPAGTEKPQGERLTGSVPVPYEFREGFEGAAPVNYQPLFPGQKLPVTPPPAEQETPPPAEKQRE